MQSLTGRTDAMTQIAGRLKVLRPKQRGVFVRLGERLIFTRGLVALGGFKARIALAKQVVGDVPIDFVLEQILGVGFARIAGIRGQLRYL